jgi:hypothetical protein
MSVLKFCVGKRAKRPYIVKNMRLRLYSMEELDYYIWENASLIDETLLGEELIQWIDEECGMEKLAKQLYEIKHFDGSVHAIAGAVLTAVGIHEAEEIKFLEKRIQMYETMSTKMREKTQADHLFLSGRYVASMERYMVLIEKMKKQEGKLNVEDNRMLVTLFHNMASACARMFFYDAAAHFYEQAYEQGQDEKELKYALLCKKLQLTPMAFEDYIVEHEQYERYVPQVEEMLRQVTEKWATSEKAVELEAAAALKKTGKSDESGRIMQDKIENWKREYHFYMIH